MRGICQQVSEECPGHTQRNDVRDVCTRLAPEGDGEAGSLPPPPPAHPPLLQLTLWTEKTRKPAYSTRWRVCTSRPFSYFKNTQVSGEPMPGLHYRKPPCPSGPGAAARPALPPSQYCSVHSSNDVALLGGGRRLVGVVTVCGLQAREP